MEQVQYIRKKLQIREFPSIKTKELGSIQAPQIIGLSFVITFILNIIGFPSLTYLILGFALPAICRYKDIKIFNYWQCFAFLLYYRTFTSAGQILDGILIIALWHPQFKLGFWAIQKIKKLKERGHIKAGITQIKKML